MADENSAGSGDDTNEPTPEGNDPEAPTSASPSTAAEPPAGAKSGASTPGQRLAAKQAAKAAQKREFKEELKRNEEEKRRKELEEADRIMGKGPVDPALPANVEKAASKFTSFLQLNRGLILAGVLGAVLIAAGGLALSRFMHSGSREQAAELARAIDLANAPIDSEDADGKTDDGKPLFKSASERAAQSAAAFAEAAKADPDSVAAAWAKLGQAAAQFSLGKAEEARATFQSAAASDVDEPAVRARSLEGVAIALEAQGKSDEALKAFEKLKEVEGQKELAEYHIARLRLAQGDEEGGKSILKALYDQLKAPKEDSPPSTYLRTEVELRLAEIDSSLVEQGSSAQQPQQFSDEQLQRLLEQLQKGKAPGAQGE